MITELCNIANGNTVEVSKLKNSPLKVKLMEMGFSSGKSIKVLFRAPLGDPMAVDIEGYVLSLRKSEAAQIMVKTTDEL